MIKDEYKRVCDKVGDINENLHWLMELAKECNHVTEMGVRYIVSTWALLEGLKEQKGTLISIDIERPEYFGGCLERVELLAQQEGVNFKFIHGNTLKLVIEPTDMLFIDTNHEYDQLRLELDRHSGNVKKYIVFHDTVSCEKELMPAITEFLANGGWKIKFNYKNNNGLMCIERC
jgi:hypothetical protein